MVMCALWCVGAWADNETGSFLTAQSFPTTFQDVSFVERMAVLKEGYEPYEIEYDKDGVCISGCAFKGMRIEDVTTYYEREAARAKSQADILRAQHPEWNQTTATPAPTPTAQAPQYIPTTPSFTTSALPGERSAKINPTQTVPYGYPMNIPMHINSKYGPRNIANGSSMHMGTDLRAPDGTPVFSTLNGKVVNATNSPNGSCGNHLKIQSADGFAIRFCHLQEIMVRPGDTVPAGAMVAKSGHSGMGRANKPYPPHLHYEIFNQNNAQIPPEPYLGVQ